MKRIYRKSPAYRLQIFLFCMVMSVFFYCRPACSGEIVRWTEAEEDSILRTVVPATCTEAGYIRTENTETLRVEIQDLPATGHAFSEWEMDENGSEKSRVCAKCGFVEHARISTVSESSFPSLSFYGSLDGIGKKQKVCLKASFSGEGSSFDCYAFLTLQGHSTLGYVKHNYTVRFYDDDQMKHKHKLQFRDWHFEHKYILKANYIDLSQCRNLVGASLWSQMAASRSNVPERIAALPSFGAVDGFPIAVYLNDAFFGLYTLNLHKDDDLYGMKEGETASILICNKETSDEALFLAPAQFAEDFSTDWECEYCGTEDETWVKERFNELIHFVLYSSDQEFHEELGRYLNVDSAVDYLLFIYALGLQYSGAKDLVLVNFGEEWIASAYDMDESFGLYADAGRYLSAEEFLPVYNSETGSWESGTGSFLWDRMLRVFPTELCNRYRELRETTLSEENLAEMVDAFVETVPEPFYDMDLNLYPDRPITDLHMEEQIKEYIRNRMPVLDELFLNAISPL